MQPLGPLRAKIRSQVKTQFIKVFIYLIKSVFVTFVTQPRQVTQVHCNDCKFPVTVSRLLKTRAPHLLRNLYNRVVKICFFFSGTGLIQLIDGSWFIMLERVNIMDKKQNSPLDTHTLSKLIVNIDDPADVWWQLERKRMQLFLSTETCDVESSRIEWWGSALCQCQTTVKSSTIRRTHLQESNFKIKHSF